MFELQLLLRKAVSLTGLRVWRTNPGSVFDYDPAEDNIQSRSLHMISGLFQSVLFMQNRLYAYTHANSRTEHLGDEGTV